MTFRHRIAIVTTHPIQYNAPFFKMLAVQEGIRLKVFYTWGGEAIKKFDPGFNKTVEWNIPLLEGYDYCFVPNRSAQPGSHHFSGMDNPTLMTDIQAWNPTVVLVYGWSFKSHLRALRFFHGKIPVFFRGDSTSLNRSKSVKTFVRKKFLRWVYSHVDVTLYAGTHNKAYFAEHGLNEHQLVFMPHAVDNDRFQLGSRLTTEEIATGKKTFGIPPEKPVFLYAGKIDENKNVALLIEAFLQARTENAHLLIAGNGNLENRLKAEYGKAENIHFIPFQNQAEMPFLYALADVVVLPSFSETWGLALNEAMACGKAVVASTGCGAATDLIHPGINGYVFENDNKTDLAQKLQELAGGKTKVEDMGKKSAALIENWSYKKNCEALVTALKKYESIVLT